LPKQALVSASGRRAGRRDEAIREERCSMTHLFSIAASAPEVPAAEVGEKLDWDAFSARYFPERRRHDLDAVAAYGAYRHGHDSQSSGRQTAPRKLPLVPNGSAPPAIDAESEGPALERLLVAVAAEQVWEGEGGFTR
jgi:hypothetical protein